MRMKHNHQSRRSLITAGVLAALVTLWMASGMLQPATATEDPAPTDASPDQPLFKVQVKRLTAEAAPLYLNLNGYMTYQREATQSAEVSGVIAQILIPKGQAVTQGTPLMILDADDRPERLNKAQFELAARKADLDATRALIRKKMASDNQLKQDEAAVAEAQADVRQIQLEIEKSTIRAPFDGIIEDTLVEQGEFVSSAQPVVRLIDHSQIKLVAQAPQQEVHKIQRGQPVTATLPDGSTLEGTVSFIASAADAESKTFRIEAIAHAATPQAQFGKSASIRIDLGATNAYKLSASLLGLDEAGDLYVKGLTEDQRVTTYPVSILRSERDGIWLEGLPDQVTLITRGQGYVANGQQVEPMEESTTPVTEGDAG